MNIVNKLTLRQLKLNKKRTLVTIIGTIISSAMITAVATLGLTFMDLMQRQNIADEGEWHVKWSNVNLEQLEGIVSEEDIKTEILSRDLGYSYLEGSKSNNKPYLFVKEFSKEGYEKFPIDLIEGRLPQANDELVISKAIIDSAKADIQIGDTLKLSIGDRIAVQEDSGEEVILTQNVPLQWEEDTTSEYLKEKESKTYTIVGIIERPEWEYTWSPGYTVLSYINKDQISSQETFDASVIFKKINNKLFDKANKISEKYGLGEAHFNNSLLRYYGVIKDDGVKYMIYGLSAIIMIIIVIGSISLIYNAFAISVSERSRYLGMLSSVGATRRQKRNSVFFEGAVIGSISIPIGILSGYAGLGITYYFINPIIFRVLDTTIGFRLLIYPSSLITSILVSVITILISTYIPARRASNVSAIDAIRQTMDYKITQKQVRTLGLTRILFGMEGDLGLKNLKRNKGRYKATVFSLVISMVLFLVVSAFTLYMKKSLVMTQDGINFDVRAMITTENKQEREKILERLITIDNYEHCAVITSAGAWSMLEEEAIADYLTMDENMLTEDGKYPYEVLIRVLDETTLEEYAKGVGVEFHQLNSLAEPTAIVIDTILYKDYEADKYVEAKSIKIELGRYLDLSSSYDGEQEGTVLPPVKIVGLTDQRPMGLMPYGNIPAFYMIMSQSSFDLLCKGAEEKELGIYTAVYYNSEKPLELQEKLEEIQNEVGVSNLNIYNVYYYKQQEEQALLLISVFTYAFILLITAICIANIINTISTSIALRKREFAMLKSVGITPKSFNKMLNFESIFYGIKALVYGLPISFAAMYLIYSLLKSNFEFTFTVPWASVVMAIVAVFVIVGLAMLYSGAKMKKKNIIDALKQEIV